MNPLLAVFDAVVSPQAAKKALRQAQAVDAALAEFPPPTAPTRAGNPAPTFAARPQAVTPELLATVGRRLPSPIATKNELEVMRRCDSEWARLQSGIADANAQLAPGYFDKHLESICGRLRRGDTVDDSEYQSRPEFERSVVAKREALKRALYDVSGEAAGVARVIADRYCAAVGELAKEAAERESAVYRDYGLNWSPSDSEAQSTFAELQRLTRVAVPDGQTNKRPAAMLVGVVEL